MPLTRNIYLAELIGIILGDGNLGNYPKYPKKKIPRIRCQYLRIYCSLDEIQYAKEIESTLIKVFKKKCYVYKRPAENVLYLEISKMNLTKLLGLPIGDKIKNQVRIPDWIFDKKEYLSACLRGLFDTDGCCYITKLKYRIVDFCNANKQLLSDIDMGLRMLGFNPYKKGEKYVELGRQNEVQSFFKIIKPKNKKHYRHAGVANVVTARV